MVSFGLLLLLVAVPWNSDDSTSPASTMMIVAEAQTYHPSGIRKGIYISPWDDGVGNVDYSTLLDGLFYYLLGNTEKEDSLLDYIVAWDFNAISIYNLRTIFSNSTKTAQLRSFISRARAKGITNIEGAVGSKNSHYDEIFTYNNDATSEDEMFDGIVTEVEFWHSDTVATLKDPLVYGRGLGIPARTGKDFYYCCYLGFVEQSDVTALEPVMDYMWPHAYSDKLTNLYSRTKERMNTLTAIDPPTNNTQTNITVIFAATGENYKPNTEFFGGDILAANKSLDLFYDTYKQYWNDDSVSPVPDIDRLGGYQWYQYTFVRLHLGEEVPTTTTTTSEPTTTTPAPPGDTTESPPPGATSSSGIPSGLGTTTTLSGGGPAATGGTDSPPSSPQTTTAGVTAVGGTQSPSIQAGAGGASSSGEESTTPAPVLGEIKCVMFCDSGADVLRLHTASPVLLISVSVFLLFPF